MWVLWAVFLSLPVLLGACTGGAGPTPAPGAAGEFERARWEYERGNYLRAIELLEGFERAHPGSRFVDDGLFLLGKAHQANGEQILARQDFDRLLRDFPRSARAEDAHFEIANSWFLGTRGPTLDAEPAEEALRSFRTYLRRYPGGEYESEAKEAIQKVLALLAEKDYLNGQTYLKLGRYGPARRYFRKSLDLWAESPVSAKALAGIAQTYDGAGAREDAIGAYRQLLEHLDGDPERYNDGRKLERKARRRLAWLSSVED
jgi:outer membrane protein assembly factor BamD